MNFLEKFSKTQQTFLYKLFSVVGQTEGGTDIMHRISKFWYDVTLIPAKYLVTLQTVQSIPHYCLSGQHGYTRGPLEDTNALRSENPNIK
jgi:hypothetical protein